MNTAYAPRCARNFASGRTTKARLTIAAVVALMVSFVFSGCATTPSSPTPSAAQAAPDTQTLKPGDTVKISFPGTPALDQPPQQIRRDGRLNLYMIGEVKAADKTPAEFEKELIQAYSSQLTSKEINVTVVASSLAVYVSGAVMRPGKILSDRPLTAFDAIMEAGGFDTKADTKNVRIIRLENGQAKSYPINMKAIMNGVQTEVFYLRPYDTVQVPEKFSWF